MRHLSLLGDLGSCLSLDKSVVQPIHVLEHLGYILNSLDMPVSTTDHNFKKFLDTTNKIFPYAIVLTWLVARLVSIIVSFFPGVEYARLFH